MSAKCFYSKTQTGSHFLLKTMGIKSLWFKVVVFALSALPTMIHTLLRLSGNDN